MAKLLEFNAYIANSSTHENIQYVGKYRFGVCVDTGISTATTGALSDFNFFQNLVDDLLMFGGDIPTYSSSDLDAQVNAIAQYAPQMNPYRLNLSDYTNKCLKLVNEDGWYMLSHNFRSNVTESQACSLYKSDGTILGYTAGCFNANGSGSNGVICAFFVVSSMNADGTFPDSGYTGIWISNRLNWGRFSVGSQANLATFLNHSKQWVPPGTDPYLPEDVAEPSAPGGGTGTFSETGDTVGIPGLPALSAVDTGFITLFNPSAAQVKALANYMWSSSFDLTTFKNIVANPIDCILGLSIVPVNPSNAGSKVVTVGNIPTDVTLPYLSSQYVEVDCGTLNVQEFWGSYLDYSPYTKMSLYLPYIGIVPLDIDDVMNASIEIKYHVDVLSGACVAYVLCNGTQLYTYVGQCSSNVPITSNDFTNTVNGILGIAGSIGKLAADGGASAPTEAAGIAANAINALKPNIQKSGAMSGTGGLMGVQTPYLICQRPRQSVPRYQNEFTGYPSNITAQLSTLTGYTEVESIHLDGLSATQEEQQEIMDLLTSGVII